VGSCTLAAPAEGGRQGKIIPDLPSLVACLERTDLRPGPAGECPSVLRQKPGTCLRRLPSHTGARGAQVGTGFLRGRAVAREKVVRS